MWLSGGFDMSRIPEEMCQHTEEKQHPSIVGGFGCVCSNLFSTAALASRPVPFMFICTTYHMYGSAIPRVTSVALAFFGQRFLISEQVKK
jgi:hypothetical protein